MTAGDLPPTSLVLCTRDRSELAADAVASVLAGEEVPDELLIIDQSRRVDRSLAALAHPRTAVRYRHSSTVGLSRSRNIGVAEAIHPTIVFIDDDVIVPPGWFGTIVRSLVSSGPEAVVTGQVLAGEPESAGAFAPSLHPGSERTVYAGRVGRDPLATFNLAMPRAAHAAAGGFDVRLGPGTRFPAGEDNDFGHRLLEAGWRIVFDPEAVVYHRAWRDDDAYVPLRHAYGRGQGAFFAKHLSLADPYMLRRWTGTLAGHVRRLPRAAIRDLRPTNTADQPRQFHAECAWISGFLAGTIDWLAARRPRS